MMGEGAGLLYAEDLVLKGSRSGSLLTKGGLRSSSPFYHPLQKTKKLIHVCLTMLSSILTICGVAKRKNKAYLPQQLVLRPLFFSDGCPRGPKMAGKEG